MAVWYVNYGNGTNTGYYAVAQWASNHVYAAGDIVRQLATPTAGQERCFRTAAGGTSGGSEPTWTITKGGSTTDNTVTWTEVSGNSTYNWSAPLARLTTATTFMANGDTAYVASIHAETQASSQTFSSGNASTPSYFICVNASGSVPPVSADLRTSATITNTSGGQTITGTFYCYGIAFINSSTAVTSVTTGNGWPRFDSCSLQQNRSAAASQIVFATLNNTNASNYTQLNNTTFSFGHVGSSITLQTGSIVWKNTASALLNTIPTNLFTWASNTYAADITLDGVDLSAAGSGKTIFAAASAPITGHLRSCELGASVTPAAAPTAPGAVFTVEISDSGATGYRQERYAYQGTLTTETTFIRAGGASDGTTPISWKVVSASNASWINPFETMQIARFFPNSTDAKTVGQSITATIEIENGGTTLTNADVWVDVEYLGSASFPLASVVSSGTADVLASGTNIPTSSVTWNGGLGSAVKQYLQVTFTPNLAGYVRATVKIAKASQTLYIDPVITIA